MHKKPAPGNASATAPAFARWLEELYRFALRPCLPLPTIYRDRSESEEIRGVHDVPSIVIAHRPGVLRLRCRLSRRRQCRPDHAAGQHCPERRGGALQPNRRAAARRHLQANRRQGSARRRLQENVVRGCAGSIRAASPPGASSAPAPISAPCPAAAPASTVTAMSCGAAAASTTSPMAAATPSSGSGRVCLQCALSSTGGAETFRRSWPDAAPGTVRVTL